MRKSRHEAAQTRKRIVAAASARFNKCGLEKTGVSDIMEAAGLTHGGFYKHFESKEQLVAESVANAFERNSLALQGPTTEASLQATVSKYLSRKHRDYPAPGCPLPSLGSELSTADDALKQIATSGIDRLLAKVQAQLPKLSKKEARKRAHAIVAAMAGAMMLSRIVTDPALSDSFLRDTKNFLLDSY